jgi:hypothetical protein
MLIYVKWQPSIYHHKHLYYIEALGSRCVRNSYSDCRGRARVELSCITGPAGSLCAHIIIGQLVRMMICKRQHIQYQKYALFLMS